MGDSIDSFVRPLVIPYVGVVTFCRFYTYIQLIIGLWLEKHMGDDCCFVFI